MNPSSVPSLISWLSNYSSSEEKEKFGNFKMSFQKEYLDLVLVPSGILIMVGYHLWLLYRCLKRPDTTVIGFENNDKKAWVTKIMQAENYNPSVPLSVLSGNITAATTLSGICLTLSSLIGAWVTNNTVFQSELIYGDTRPTTISIKYMSLLLCFLMAFAFFVQSARSLIYANYLISAPDANVPIDLIELAVIRGGDFWSLGIRAIYFALVLLLWFLGPIPMFATSVAMVCFLGFLDTNTTTNRNALSGKRLATEV